MARRGRERGRNEAMLRIRGVEGGGWSCMVCEARSNFGLLDELCDVGSDGTSYLSLSALNEHGIVCPCRHTGSISAFSVAV